MTLQEAKMKLSTLNAEIDRLLEERENILKEWTIAFNTENPNNITCVDENVGDSHKLYLVNGESIMPVCQFDSFDMRSGLNDFYRRLDNSIQIFGIVNRQDFKIPDYQKNLIYAKAIEIRKKFKNEKIVPITQWERK